MPHNDDPFLRGLDDTPDEDPFLAGLDPEEPEEDRNSVRGIMSRFASRLSRFFTPTRPTGTPQERTQSARALASGPLGTAEDLVQGAAGAVSDLPFNPFTPSVPGGRVPGAEQASQVDIPGSEPPEGFEGLGLASRAGSELAALVVGGAGVGRFLAKLGAPTRIAEGGGLLGDVARFGPVDALFAQNPETSGALALSELAGQEGLSDELRDNRLLRTVAEPLLGAIPGAAIQGLARGLRGQQRFARRAAGMRPDPSDAERLGLEVTGRVPSLEVTRELPPSPLDRIRRGADEIRGDEVDRLMEEAGMEVDETAEVVGGARASGGAVGPKAVRDPEAPDQVFVGSTHEEATEKLFDEIGRFRLDEQGNPTGPRRIVESGFLDENDRFLGYDEALKRQRQQMDEVIEQANPDAMSVDEMLDRGLAEFADDGTLVMKEDFDAEDLARMGDQETVESFLKDDIVNNPRVQELARQFQQGNLHAAYLDAQTGETILAPDALGAGGSRQSHYDAARNSPNEEVLTDALNGELTLETGFATPDGTFYTRSELEELFQHDFAGESINLTGILKNDVPIRDIGAAGFALPEVMGVLGRMAIGGVGGTVASTQIEGLDPLAGAIGGAALGAGAPQLLRYSTKGLDKVADWRAARSAENLGDAADDVLPELEQLSKSDQKFLRDILEADDISGASARTDDPVDEAVRVTVPKDLDANEVTARLDAKLAQSATRRQRSEQYQRVRQAIQEGRLDDEQLKINATIAKIGRMDPATVEQALRTGEPEQILAASLRYGTAIEGVERLQTLMGRIGGQLPPQQLDILQAKLRELNQMADDAMDSMLGGASEAGRALRMAREKIRSLPLDPQSINLHEARARQVAEGSFDSDDRARLMRILSDNAEPDVADIMVASALGRTVTGGVLGSGVGLVADGKEGAAVGALAGMGAGVASLPIQRISQISRARDLLQPGGQLRGWIDSLEPDDRKALLLTRFMQEMEGRAKSGGEKVAQLVKAGLLTAIKTDIINLASTTSWMAARRVGNALAALIDRVIGKAFTGQRSVALQRPTLKGGFAKFDEETGELVIETGRMRNALNEAREVWRGHKEARDALKRLDFSGYRSGNAFVDGMMTYGFRRLGAEDRAMKGLAFHTALHERARIQAMNELGGRVGKGAEMRKAKTAAEAAEVNQRAGNVEDRVKELVASPPDDLAMRAWADAEEATFTNVNAAGEAVVDFKRALRRQGSLGAIVADVGVPFVNTLVNVADSFLKTSPLGFVRPKTMRNLGKLLADANNMPMEAQRELSQALALATTGTVVPFAVGAVLWQKGLMTGPWPTDNQANVMAQGNFQPYALIVGDYTVSMENVSPWGNVMSLGAHTMALAADAEVTGAETAAKVRNFDRLPAAEKLSVAGEVAKNPEIWTGMMGAAFSQLSELSFLANVTTLLEGVTDPGRSEAMFDNLGRMAVPTAARQAASSDIPVIGDPTFRDGGGPFGLGDIPGVGAAIASTPVLSRTLEPQIDRFGQERKRDPAIFFESAGNPFRIEKINQHPVIKELTRLGVGIADLTTPDRRDVEDAEQLTVLRKVYGRVLAARLEGVINSDPFQALSDDRRREVLESTIRTTRSQTSRALQAIGELPPVPEDAGAPAPFFQRVGGDEPGGGETDPFLQGLDAPQGVQEEDDPFLQGLP